MDTQSAGSAKHPDRPSSTSPTAAVKGVPTGTEGPIDDASLPERKREAARLPGPKWLRANALLAAMAVLEALPAWFNLGIMVSLIFGGCCSNVFALEALVRAQPDSGLLITFAQLIPTILSAWPDQFSRRHPPLFLKPTVIPIRRWLFSILLFFTVNTLNNMAFGYKISVPVHIILRSGGSVCTILVGWLWGKRYTRVQVISVAFLTVGVIIAAMADAQAQGKTSSNPASDTTSFLTGLLILLVAQILSAVMGLHVQSTYAQYGSSHWRENLFYSHLLSLPLFIPFAPRLRHQFSDLVSSPGADTHRITLDLYRPIATLLNVKGADPQLEWNFRLPHRPSILVVNALTQVLCIRGVSLLAARSSALTVTIVLNIRKLVSLMASIWLFGNELAPGVLVGAAVVFGSGVLYAWEGQRQKPRQPERERHEEEDGGTKPKVD